MKKYVWVEPNYGVEMGVPSGRAPTRFVGFDPRPATPIWNALQFVNNDSNDYKFAGKKRDFETGLDYFGARICWNAPVYPLCCPPPPQAS